MHQSMMSLYFGGFIYINNIAEARQHSNRVGGDFGTGIPAHGVLSIFASMLISAGQAIVSLGARCPGALALRKPVDADAVLLAASLVLCLE
jgi:hypothetical protein